MKNISKPALLTMLLALTAIHAQAQTHWSAALQLGTVYNVPLPLKIVQDGYPDLNLTARFYTEPLTLPVYWDLRLARWHDRAAWEFEVIHHKLYLQNTNAEVEHFGISHGFNLLMGNRVWQLSSFEARLGGGLVLAHPENTVRGKTFGQTSDDLDMGYHLTGPVLNFAFGKALHLSPSIFLNFEVKSTLARAQVKIADGHASLWNWTLHAVCGIGFDFARKEAP